MVTLNLEKTQTDTGEDQVRGDDHVEFLNIGALWLSSRLRLFGVVCCFVCGVVVSVFVQFSIN
jgi:hypothetical protein